MAFRAGSSDLPDFLDFFFFFLFFSVAAAESSGIPPWMQVGDVRPDCVRGVDSSETKMVAVVSVSGEEGVFVVESKRTTILLMLTRQGNNNKKVRRRAGQVDISRLLVGQSRRSRVRIYANVNMNFPRFRIQQALVSHLETYIFTMVYHNASNVQVTKWNHKGTAGMVQRTGVQQGGKKLHCYITLYTFKICEAKMWTGFETYRGRFPQKRWFKEW